MSISENRPTFRSVYVPSAIRQRGEKLALLRLGTTLVHPGGHEFTYTA